MTTFRLLTARGLNATHLLVWQALTTEAQGFHFCGLTTYGFRPHRGEFILRSWKSLSWSSWSLLWSFIIRHRAHKTFVSWAGILKLYTLLCKNRFNVILLRVRMSSMSSVPDWRGSVMSPIHGTCSGRLFLLDMETQSGLTKPVCFEIPLPTGDGLG